MGGCRLKPDCGLSGVVGGLPHLRNRCTLTLPHPCVFCKRGNHRRGAEQLCIAGMLQIVPAMTGSRDKIATSEVPTCRKRRRVGQPQRRGPREKGGPARPPARSLLDDCSHVTRSLRRTTAPLNWLLSHGDFDAVVFDGLEIETYLVIRFPARCIGHVQMCRRDPIHFQIHRRILVRKG